MSVELVNVHKAFGPKQVLKGLTLSIPEGKTTTVVGGSGSGKSVALKHIVGLLKPDEGDVWVDGENVGRLDSESLYRLRRKVGYVFQFAALFDSLTIAENVGLGLRRVPGMSRSEIDARVAECLRLVDLAGFEERMPSELSGGQRKRVGLARAIATNPKYLLYDEPTTGLDPITIRRINGLILRLQERLGVTSVVVTHDMDTVFTVTDRLALVYDKHIAFTGKPEEARGAELRYLREFVKGGRGVLEEDLG